MTRTEGIDCLDPHAPKESTYQPLEDLASTRGFKVVFFNIISLVYIDELKIAMPDRISDLPCFNETCLDESILDNLIEILGYLRIRKDLPSPVLSYFLLACPVLFFFSLHASPLLSSPLQSSPLMSSPFLWSCAFFSCPVSSFIRSCPGLPFSLLLN